MRKTKNKTLFRVDFESLMTNMAIFSTSVALLPNKITEKTAKTVVFSPHYNTKKFTNFIQNHTKNFLIHSWLISKNLNKNQLCDVITVIFMISYAALLRLHFLGMFFNLTYYVLQRKTLYGIAKQLFLLMSSISYCRPKWRKWPLKSIFA